MTRRQVAVLAVVLVLGALTACKQPAARTRASLAVEIPDDWATTPAEPDEIPLDWWHPYGGDVLPALVDEALAHNPDLQAAATRLDVARAQAVITGADRSPQASVGASRTRDKRVFIGLPVPGTENVSTLSTAYSLSFDTSWELDLWGRLAAAEEAARAEVRAAEADLAGARLSLVGATVKAWLALVEAHLQVGVAERSATNWTNNRRLVERRYRAGLRTAVDLRIVAASEAAAEARLAVRRRNEAQAARSLDVLLGRYPAGELRATRDLPRLDNLAPTGVPAALLSRRPDLAAAEHRLAAAEFRVTEAQRAFYPDLTLIGSAGTSSDDMGDLLDGDFTVWSFVSRFTQPVWEGGRLRARVDLTDAVAAEALALFAGTLLDAFAEVENALDAERRLAEEEAALAIAAVEAREARTLAAQRYGSGLEDVVTLLETERGAQVAESELLAARRERLVARIDLHLALGGGFGTTWTTDPLIEAPRALWLQGAQAGEQQAPTDEADPERQP